MDDAEQVGNERIREALRRGVESAINVLVPLYGPAIYSRCCRILKNPGTAEDAMQQVLTTTYERCYQLIAVQNIRGWLLQVATRKCIDIIRSRDRTERTAQAAAKAGGDSAPDLLEQLASARRLRALEECLAELEGDLHAAVVLRYRDGMSWEDIGKQLNKKSDSLRIAVGRAFPRLRDCIASKETEDAEENKDETKKEKTKKEKKP